MVENFYKQLLEESTTGYAYHKIICDEEGIPYDFEIMEVNTVVEILIGLKEKDLVGRKFTDAFSYIGKDEYDWI